MSSTPAYFGGMNFSAPDPAARGPLAPWLQRFWRDTLLSTEPRRRGRLAIATLALVAVIGFIDYRLGPETSMLAFYCLPVLLGTAVVNWKFGVLIAFMSVGAWISGDVVSGAPYSAITEGWNALIALSTYLVIVWLFATVQTLQREMQERVRQRTAALTAEIAERERLEKILLEISERERASIGRELHDNLGQHLTGTAFAGQVLGEKLQALGLPEQGDAWKIVALIEEGIEKTRHLAKGLFLDEFHQTGLVTALRELAADTAAQYRIQCEFRQEGESEIPGKGAAGHLLRIAQEAVRNAARHGHAPRIEIALLARPDGVELTVRDHGRGLPPAETRSDGLGLRIMAHRAQIMNAEFNIEALPPGGTLVRCRLPLPSSHHDDR